jgi:DNA-binding transcriptional ArsR family regulator
MPSTRKTTQHADADVFAAIAHPVRRKILDLLSTGDRTVNALAQPFAEEPFCISRPAISQHLSILLESGLVTKQKRGREQVYHLRPDNLNEVFRWIKQYEQFWTEKLDALGSFLDSVAENDDEA